MLSTSYRSILLNLRKSKKQIFFASLFRWEIEYHFNWVPWPRSCSQSMGGLGSESRLTHSKAQELNYCGKSGFIIPKEELISTNYTSFYLKKKKNLQVNTEPLPIGFHNSQIQIFTLKLTFYMWSKMPDWLTYVWSKVPDLLPTWFQSTCLSTAPSK